MGIQLWIHDALFSRLPPVFRDAFLHPHVRDTACVCFVFGTGIENVNIMEHKFVMSLQHPLVIFYPSKIENDNIYFLNFKPASKYRCTLVK